MNIIQIGTCVGDDDVTNLIQNNKIDSLVLIEPMSIHNKSILDCYKNVENVFLENIAITYDDRKEISFFYHQNDGPKYEVSSMDKNHILKHGYNEQGIVELKVQSMTLNELFDKYNLSNIDVLFIDAEGIDDKLIKSIDFEKFQISKIFFENLHITDSSIYNFLINLGYEITQSTGFMGWSSLASKKI